MELQQQQLVELIAHRGGEGEESSSGKREGEEGERRPVVGREEGEKAKIEWRKAGQK